MSYLLHLYTAKGDDSRFKFVLPADQSNVIKNEMSV